MSFVGVLLLPAAFAAVDPAPPRLDASVSPLSQSHLLVRVDEGTDFDRDPEAWSLSSESDPDFAGGRAPVGVAVRTRADHMIPEGWPFRAVVVHEVLLSFDATFDAGADYVLTDGRVPWSFALDPDRDLTPSIKMNQVGASTDALGRHAYVSFWLAGLPELELAGDRTSFHVVDAATGATALSGVLTLRHASNEGGEDAEGSNFTWANVYDADLGDLDAPGDYYLVWDGVGRSHTFTIAEDVWNEPFRLAFRALFHHRCGMALEARYTDWPHAACHVQSVNLTTDDPHETGWDAFGSLPELATGEQVEASGGYHDAGDYDKRYPHFVVVDSLVDLYEMQVPGRDWEGAGIPESGNGIPDMLDEAAYGLGLYAALQSESGGIRAGVETTAYPGLDVMPEDDVSTLWYAYAEDVDASYWFAGVAAKLSRVLAPFAADAAASWLERARAAWSWAESHEGADETRSRAAYAAAELHHSTAEAQYLDAFRQRGPGLDFELNDWDGGEWYPALWAMAIDDAAPADLRDAAVAVIRTRADAWISWGERTGYRIIKHPYAPITYGSGTSPYETPVLVRAHYLTGDARYLEWATYSADLELGAHASGWSWVTGIGRHSVRGVLDTPSLADGIEAPVPGIPLYGPSTSISGSSNTAVVVDAFDPPITEWPPMERYADVSYVPTMNEYTVSENIAPTVLLFGYLARLDVTGGGDGDADTDTDTDADVDTDSDTDLDADADGNGDAGVDPGAVPGLSSGCCRTIDGRSDRSGAWMLPVGLLLLGRRFFRHR